MNRPFFGPMSFRTDGTVLPGALYMPHVYSVFPYAPSESWRIVNELHQEIGCAFGVCLGACDDDDPDVFVLQARPSCNT